MDIKGNSNEFAYNIELRQDMTLAEKKEILLNSLLQAGDLNEFVDCLSILVDLPLLIMSPSYSTIAYSRIHKVTDNIWNYAMNIGYYPDFIISYIIKNNREWDLSHKNRELFERSLPNSEYKRLICNMWHRNEQMGAILALLSGEAPDDDKKELLLFARDLLQKVLALGGSRAEKVGTAQELLLIEILKGKIPNQDAHYDRFLLDNINDPGYFLLINVEFHESKESNGFMNTFRILFPQATIFVYSNRLLIFFAQQTSIKIGEGFLTMLEELLSSCNAIACISDEYTDLFRTREHYCKNVRIGKLAASINEPRRLLFYDEFRLIDMYLLAANSIGVYEADSFVCRKAYEIYEYDQKHKTEYIETLWHYFNTKESASGAGKAMFVHKNTITYRILRIKDLFQLDISRFENNFMLYFSCGILRFLKKMQFIGNADWKDIDWGYGCD